MASHSLFAIFFLIYPSAFLPALTSFSCAAIDLLMNVFPLLLNIPEHVLASPGSVP